MITRREFLRVAGVALATSRAGAGIPILNWAPARTLRLALLLPPADPSLASVASDWSAGAALALSETERAAQLFGQRISLSERRIDQNQKPEDVIARDHPSVIIGGASATECAALAQAAEAAGVLFLNLGSTDDALRRSDCRRHMFHVAASDAMIDSARRAASSANGPISIELWHPSLTRYGGAELNDRYADRFKRPMTSNAWAAWVAVKIAWETSLKARSVEPAALLSVLENDSTGFDGHKGTQLSFRAWDHQLRQPLYAVSNATGAGRVVAELPDVGRNNDQGMRELLDQFGDLAGSASCFARGAA